MTLHKLDTAKDTYIVISNEYCPMIVSVEDRNGSEDCLMLPKDKYYMRQKKYDKFYRKLNEHFLHIYQDWGNQRYGHVYFKGGKRIETTNYQFSIGGQPKRLRFQNI